MSHYTVCADIVHGLANCLLQTIASSVTGQIDVAFKEFSDFTLEEKGKIRYISGWVLKRLWEKGRLYINGNITSESKEVRDRIKNEILQCKILNGLMQTYVSLQQSSFCKETLEITESKQYRTGGLTHVSDEAFLFFGQIEERRIKLLNHARLHKLKGDLLSDSLQSIQQDAKLRNQWQQLCDPCRLDITQNDEQKKLAFDKCVTELYKLGTEKYFKMGAGQYLRDFRRDFQWKKKEAHRKKVLMRSHKKALLTDKVQMDSIKSDSSTNKVS